MRNPHLYITIAILSLLLVISIYKGCKHCNSSIANNIGHNLERQLKHENDSLISKIAELRLVKETEKAKMGKSLDSYQAKPVRDRIADILKIDTAAIMIDTGVILSLHGIDSMNRLVIRYSGLANQLNLSDSIIIAMEKKAVNDSILYQGSLAVIIDRDNKIKKLRRGNRIREGIIVGLAGLLIFK